MRRHELDWDAYAEAEQQVAAWEKRVGQRNRRPSSWERRGRRMRPLDNGGPTTDLQAAARRKQRGLAVLALDTWYACGLPNAQDTAVVVPVQTQTQHSDQMPIRMSVWALCLVKLTYVIRHVVSRIRKRTVGALRH